MPQHAGAPVSLSSLEALHSSQASQAAGLHSLSQHHPSFHIAAASLLPASAPGSGAPPPTSYYGMSIHPAHALPPGSLAAPQFMSRGGVGAASSLADAQAHQGQIYFQGASGEGSSVSQPHLSAGPSRQQTVLQTSFYARPVSSPSMPQAGPGGDTPGGLPSSFASPGTSEGVVRVSSLGSGGGSAYAPPPPGGTGPHAPGVYTPQRTALAGTPEGRADPPGTGGGSGGNVHDSGAGSYKASRAGEPPGGAGSGESSAVAGQNSTGVVFPPRPMPDNIPGVVVSSGGPGNSLPASGAYATAARSTGAASDSPALLLTGGALSSPTGMIGPPTPSLVVGGGGSGGGEEYRQQLALHQQALQQQAGYFYYGCYGGVPVASQQPTGHPAGAPGGGGVEAAYAYTSPSFPYQRGGSVPSGSGGHADQSAAPTGAAPGEDASAPGVRAARQSGYNSFKGLSKVCPRMSVSSDLSFV